jgi:hypothetical protein
MPVKQLWITDELFSAIKKQKMSGVVYSSVRGRKTVFVHDRVTRDLLGACSADQDTGEWFLYLPHREDEGFFALCSDDTGQFNIDIYDRVSLGDELYEHDSSLSSLIIDDDTEYLLYDLCVTNTQSASNYSIYQHDVKGTAVSINKSGGIVDIMLKDSSGVEVPFVSGSGIVPGVALNSKLFLQDDYTADGLIDYGIIPDMFNDGSDIVSADFSGGIITNKSSTGVSLSNHSDWVETDEGKFGHGCKKCDYYGYMGTNLSLSNNNEWSFSLWIKVDDAVNSSYRPSIMYQLYGFSLRYRPSDTRIYIKTGNGSSWYSEHSFSCGTLAMRNVWRHIVVTVSSTETKLYFQGVLKNSWSVTGISDSTGEHFLYFDNSSGYNASKHTIDMLRIFNRVVTATEVDSLFKEIPAEPYQLDSIHGTCAYDDSIALLGVIDPILHLPLRGDIADRSANGVIVSLKSVALLKNSVVFGGDAAIHTLPMCSDTSSDSIGDESEIAVNIKFKCSDMSNLPQVLYKSGDSSNGAAVGINTSGNVGVYGCLSGVVTSIDIPNDIIEDKIYIVEATSSGISLFTDDYTYIATASGSITIGDGSGQQSVGGACAGSPMTASSSNDYFVGEIFHVHASVSGSLSYSYDNYMNFGCELSNSGAQCLIESAIFDVENENIEYKVSVPLLSSTEDNVFRMYVDSQVDNSASFGIVPTVGSGVEWDRLSALSSSDSLIVYDNVGHIQGWENAEFICQVKIDHTKIDEPLVDFPIKLNFGRYSGTTGEHTHLFTKYCICDYLQSSGTAEENNVSTGIDTELFDWSMKVNKIEIKNKKLNIYTKPGGHNGAWIWFKEEFDFNEGVLVTFNITPTSYYYGSTPGTGFGFQKTGCSRDSYYNRPLQSVFISLHSGSYNGSGMGTTGLGGGTPTKKFAALSPMVEYNIRLHISPTYLMTLYVDGAEYATLQLSSTDIATLGDCQLYFFNSSYGGDDVPSVFSDIESTNLHSLAIFNTNFAIEHASTGSQCFCEVASAKNFSGESVYPQHNSYNVTSSTEKSGYSPYFATDPLKKDGPLMNRSWVSAVGHVVRQRFAFRLDRRINSSKFVIYNLFDSIEGDYTNSGVRFIKIFGSNNDSVLSNKYSDDSHLTKLGYFEIPKSTSIDDFSEIDVQNDKSFSIFVIKIIEGWECPTGSVGFRHIEVVENDFNEIQMYTKVPFVSDSTDEVLNIYMDSSQNNDGYVGSIGSTAAINVWDSNFESVFHGILTVDGLLKDSTGNNDMDSFNVTDAYYDGGNFLRFNGQDSVCKSYVADMTPLTDEYSLEVSHNIIGDLSNDHILFFGTTSGIMPFIGGTSSINRYAVGLFGNSSDSVFLSSSGIVNITSTFSGTSVDLFVDGVHDSSKVVGTLSDMSSINFYIGGDERSSGVEFYEGDVSEVRISNIKRADAWIKASSFSSNDELLEYTNISTYFDGLPEFNKKCFTGIIPASSVNNDVTDFPLSIFINNSSGVNLEDLTRIINEFKINTIVNNTNLNSAFGFHNDCMAGFTIDTLIFDHDNYGRVNNSIFFDGASDASLIVEDSFRNSLLGDLTITFWIRNDNLSSDKAVFGTSYYGEISIHIGTNNTMHVYFGQNTSYRDHISAPIPARHEEFVHVAYVRDTKNNVHSLYFSGVLTVKNDTVYNAHPTTFPIEIGDNSWKGPIVGAIFDFMVFDSALPDRAIYNIANSRDFSTPTGFYYVTLFRDDFEFKCLLGESISSIDIITDDMSKEIACAVSADTYTYHVYSVDSWIPVASKDDTIHGNVGNDSWFIHDGNSWVISNKQDEQYVLSELFSLTEDIMDVRVLCSLTATEFSSLFNPSIGIFDIAVGMFSADNSQHPSIDSIVVNNKKVYMSDEYDLSEYATITGSKISWGYINEDNASVYSIITGNSSWSLCSNGGEIQGITQGMDTAGKKLQIKTVLNIDDTYNPYIEIVIN